MSNESEVKLKRGRPHLGNKDNPRKTRCIRLSNDIWKFLGQSENHARMISMLVKEEYIRNIDRYKNRFDVE